MTQALESEGIRGEAEKIGIGAGAGAILGAILGGAKGALAGILIGGGGTIAATEGKDVDLPTGTVLRVRLDEPLRCSARSGSASLEGRVAGRAVGQVGRSGELDDRFCSACCTPCPPASADPRRIASPRARRDRLVDVLRVCAADRNHASNCDGGG